MAIFMESIIEVPHAFGINTAVGAIGLGLCFVGGWIADYFGRKARVPIMLISSLIFGIVAPFFLSIMGEGDPWMCFLLQLTMAILLGIFGGAMQPWLIANFPPRIRLTSTNISYNLAVALIGGFSPAAATLLVDHFNNAAPGFIITGLTVLAWIGLWVGSSGPKWDDNKVEMVPNRNLSSVV
jgi:MHS family proline/betaine transporter-like MFS transporter